MIDLIGTRVPRLAARYYPDLLWRASTSEKVLYLTFDDGPTPELTAFLLRTLQKYEAPSTFFLVGENAALYPDLVRALAADGHVVGNHTYTHPEAWRTPHESVSRELSETTILLEDLAQQPVRLMRPPYGRFTSRMRTWCTEYAQRMVMWDVMPGDFLPMTTAPAIARCIQRFIRPGSIVVLHDNPKVSEKLPEVLETLLPELRTDGWRFATL